MVRSSVVRADPPAAVAQLTAPQQDVFFDDARAISRGALPSETPYAGDLKAALDANPAALAYFEAMKKQERFQVIFRITNIKTPAIRAARIPDVVEKAARGESHYK